ncbi:conserved hypothetical protein [Frankia sp. Hr75.2]|nr:conserved hypothetical protein [Frankia sp. Hr75.2]
MARVLAAVTAEIAEHVLPERHRSNPRVVRRANRTPFPAKKPIDRHLTGPPPSVVTVLTRT